MEDLDSRIRRLSDLDRVPLIQALIRIDAEMKRLARSGRRARLGTPSRNRADDALEQTYRLGQIIYFLRFRSPATNTRPGDLAFCDMLAEKLRAKGQWTGDVS
jgi:hypothetical protein